MEGYISIGFMIIGFLILYYVIQIAVTKGINNSAIGKLLEKENGERVNERVNESLTIEDVLEKYKKRDNNNKS
ncbi:MULTISPECIES: hypothetical protein [Bacillaceae]|uniref:hypothetical protein n=1 Tax=Bacillaceae TaxID=186817 RepID=UPI0006F2B27A|nr:MULTISPECIES: hypothetical protein [Bacillaceae]KQL33698.1 hypothetical protein AN959_16360 [Psychrobacillus sp. FJAT-21963]MDF2066640.1 hypothetical protein [Bacillus sp. Cr_A10]